MGKVRTHIVREISSESFPPLTIRRDEKHPDVVCLIAVSEESKNHWGNLDIVMTGEFAIHLGNALLAAGKEAD